MFERFNAESRQVLVDSQMEARRLNHDFIGCEHFLLALARQPRVGPVLAAAGVDHDRTDTAVRRRLGTVDLDAGALANVGIDLGAVRDRVEESFGAGALEAAAVGVDRRLRRRWRPRTRWLRGGCRRPPTGGSAWPVPFTARAKSVLEQALRVAQRVGSPTIEPEHLASAVVAISDGIVPVLLAEFGVDKELLQQALQEPHGPRRMRPE